MRSESAPFHPQMVLIELPVVTCQPEVKPLERAWTSVGTSAQNWFDMRRKPEVMSMSWPSCVGMAAESEFDWR